MALGGGRPLFISIQADTKGFGKSLSDAEKRTKKFHATVEKMGKAAGLAFAALGAFAIKFGIDAVKSASDFNEELSKSQVIFGETAKSIEDFSKSAAKSLGLSQKQALEATSTFATFGKAAGLTGKDLANFSTDATGLAADLGSFYNTSADDAINAIGAALRGESEPIRRYGILINDATLKATAMSMGLYKGKGNLDLQAKSLAAYRVILNQSKDAQGDFARTSGGLAGSTKILSSELANLRVNLGSKLIPILLNTFRVVQQISDGFSGKNGLAKRVGEASDALSSARHEKYADSWYSVGESLKSVADSFGKLFGAVVGPNGEKSISSIQKIAGALETLANGIDALSDAYKKLMHIYELPGIKQFKNFQIGNRNAILDLITGGGQPNQLISGGGMQPLRGNGVTININGAVDANGTRRQIEQLLKGSARQMGQVNLVGTAL
jgi:hypothetical protein